VRPSYVLGGRAMQIIRDEAGLDSYLLGTVPELVPEDIKARYPNDKTGQINTLLGTNPLLFDSYLTNAIEVDVDCLCDGRTSMSPASWSISRKPASIPAIQRLLAAGPFALARDGRRLERQTVALARALNVGGLMNVQYAIKDDEIYVLEVNPRASRTVPFVAKTVGSPIAKIAARVMAGENARRLSVPMAPCPTTASSTTSRSRKRSSRLPSSPASTRCSGRKCARPARSWARPRLCPGLRQGAARRRQRAAALGHRVHLGPDERQAARCRGGDPVRQLASSCWRPPAPPIISASRASPATKINKVLEGRPHIEDAIRNRQVQMVHQHHRRQAKTISDSKSLRRAALMQKVPYFTTMAGSLSPPRSPRSRRSRCRR
jgi:carbamoyl-phosphate synthase large subunit